MEPVEQGITALISGIEADARAEEQKLLADARSAAEEKRHYARQKIESILNEARSKADEQAESIRRKTLSAVELEIKRRSLEMRDALVHRIMDRVEERFGSMIDEPDYRTTLTNWVVEAAIGLEADAAQVNASHRERPLIDAAMLQRVAERVRAQTGKQVTLTLSEGPPLKGQGVILTTMDGRMAFNNQVRTRMLRKQREIQKQIYDRLFAGRREE
jgi:vacuolar-type H+-ATPase subunit E/Vma4